MNHGNVGISIIVPTLNEERNLPGLFASIAAAKEHCQFQSELIVVDNGSHDRTVEIARKEADKVLLAQGTVFEARSQGVAAASCSWILFLDADHIVPLASLRECECAMISGEASAFILAERTANQAHWVSRALSLDRKLIELSGRGIPRLFERRQLAGVLKTLPPRAFGEDYAILLSLDPKYVRYLSKTTILHRDITSVASLAVKYYRYGSKAAYDKKFILSVANFNLRNLFWLTFLEMLQDPITSFQTVVLRMTKLVCVTIGLRFPLQEG